MADKKRIVVTGFGMLSPLGVGAAENWNALIHGRSGIGLITSFDHQACKVHVAGECKTLDATQFGFSARDAKRYDRSVLLCIGRGRSRAEFRSRFCRAWRQ